MFATSTPPPLSHLFPPLAARYLGPVSNATVQATNQRAPCSAPVVATCDYPCLNDPSQSLFLRSARVPQFSDGRFSPITGVRGAERARDAPIRQTHSVRRCCGSTDQGEAVPRSVMYNPRRGPTPPEPRPATAACSRVPERQITLCREPRSHNDPREQHRVNAETLSGKKDPREKVRWSRSDASSKIWFVRVHTSVWVLRRRASGRERRDFRRSGPWIWLRSESNLGFCGGQAGPGAFGPSLRVASLLAGHRDEDLVAEHASAGILPSKRRRCLLTHRIQGAAWQARPSHGERRAASAVASVPPIW